ncbi:MAG: hypothetical protein U0804_14035, partial [Gemmataceae bacterium]
TPGGAPVPARPPHTRTARAAAGRVYAALAAGPTPAADLTKTPPPRAGLKPVPPRVGRPQRAALGDLLRGLAAAR